MNLCTADRRRFSHIHPMAGTIALPSGERWFLVLANDEEISTVAVGTLGLSLLSDDESASWTGPSELQVSFEILPLGYAVVEIAPAE